MAIGYNRLPKIAAAAPALVEQAVARAAVAVQAAAQAQAPVDTGNLRGSITAVRMGPMLWHVVASAAYAVYVELGTRHMGAQPYLDPALRRVFPRFVADLRGVLG